MHGNSSLPIGTLYGIAEDYHLLSQSKRFIKGLSILPFYVLHPTDRERQTLARETPSENSHSIP